MRKAIVLGSVLALAALSSVYFTVRTEPLSTEESPAFQALLSQAIARLDGVTAEITAAGVGEAHAAVQQLTIDGTPTCDGTPGCEYQTVYGQDTCDRDNSACWDLTYDPSVPTCDPGLATCDATITCTRYYTCDSQFTCHGEQTCDGSYTCWNSTCDQPLLTCDGSETCTGPPDCVEYTMQGNYTCDGSPTCHNTCEGWPNCGPTGTERTTWGKIKKEFVE